jgi:hypothetical protein
MIIEFYALNIFVKDTFITSVGPRRGGPEEYLGRYGPSRAIKNGPISRPGRMFRKFFI